MILSFKEHFDKAKTKPTFFREKIFAGVHPNLVAVGTYDNPIKYPLTVPLNIKPKHHTLRAGHRWKKGDIMHMAYGVRTKNYQQFNKGIPELAVVTDVQDIRIEIWKYTGDMKSVEIIVDGVILFAGQVLPAGANSCDSESRRDIEKLAINDGFENSRGFFQWFNSDFSGQIIHWTDSIRY